MIIQSMMAMTNALGTMSAREGHKVNFGIARGVGSLSFAVAALALGPLTVGFGNDIIPWLGVILYAGLGAAVLFFPMKKQAVSAARAKRAGFASRYPRFMVFLAASVCLYTAHSLLNNFMFQIISAKGGGNEALGVASAIAAVVELPVMFAFTRLLKILPVGRWLIISGFAFLLKSLVTFLTPTVGGLYAAQALQIFAFAVMAVASVYYTDQIMEPQDAVKGQAFLSMTATAGAVIASSCGGWILDVSGVNMLLIVSITFAAVGALIAWLCLRKQPAG